MNWRQKLQRRFRALFHKDTLDAQMDEEMRSHIELQTQANIEEGMTPEQARYAAMRQFGHADGLKEKCRDQRGVNGADNLLRELRHAARSLFKNPGFTLIAIITLALGIGLNTAMFSFMNALMLRPLPFPQSNQLVHLYRGSPHESHGGISPADFADLKQQESAFGEFVAQQRVSAALTEPDRPAELLNAMRVSPEFFQVLKVGPRLGRLFDATEDYKGDSRVAVISHALWRDRFGASRDIIGRIIRLDNEPYQVIGVLPVWASDHRVFGQLSIFQPLVLKDGQQFARSGLWLNVLGRRSSTVSVEQGEAFIRALGAQIVSDHPQFNEQVSWRTESLPVSTISPTGKLMLGIVLGLSTFVLLIACSNLANLLLARTIERAREFAVRAALGASRWQLIRPLAMESLVLAALGGTGALLVALWTSDWLRSVIQSGGGPGFEFPMDWRVLVFAVIMSGATLLFFGLAPALYAMRINTNDTLKNTARGSTGGRGHQRLRHTLIVGQFAMAMILLAGAGFMLRGAENMVRQYNGWDSENVVQGEIRLPDASYRDNAAVVNFQRQAVERLEQLPGVTAVSVSYGLPYLGLRGSTSFVSDKNETSVASSQGLNAKINGVSADYFKVTGSRLIHGRYFTAADTGTAPKVAIISDTMARALFPGENPLGRRVTFAGSTAPEWMEVVGIVEDVRSIDVAQPPAPNQLYRPLEQDTHHGFMIAVRTQNIAPETAISAIRSAIAELDKDLPISELMTANKRMQIITSQMYLFKRLLTAFAVLGLLLATLGIYGVVARAVAQRTGEIGIRMALGAQVRDVTKLVLGSGVRLALVGAGIGVLGGIGLHRLFSLMLPSMKANGGWVLAIGILMLIGIALIACWIPARRAAKVDPLTALRYE